MLGVPVVPKNTRISVLMIFQLTAMLVSGLMGGKGGEFANEEVELARLQQDGVWGRGDAVWTPGRSVLSVVKRWISPSVTSHTEPGLRFLRPRAFLNECEASRLHNHHLI